MATEFAYVPATCDGRTVLAVEPLAIDISPDPDADLWAWLREPRNSGGQEALKPVAAEVAVPV